MIYKQFQDVKLSALGLGMMRLPTLGDDSAVDEAAVAEMVDYALKNGINYFDTAWGYHGGNSELVAGKCLSRYPRESYYLASKFPGYSLENMPYAVDIFHRQQEKCKTDYFDFYLFHNVCEMNIDAYLDKKFAVRDHLVRFKEEGKIKHLGFSAHGEIPVLKRFLDAYAKDVEFCQLQINWLDWHFQNAKEKVQLIASYGLPVWVMEPVRGGRLTNLSQEHWARLQSLRPEETPAGWAFRFIQSIPEVTMTLSGMSDMTQLKENVKTFSENKPLNEQEYAVLMQISAEMTGRKSLPCTACRYCTTYCPKGLNIPEIIRLYNEHCFSDGGFLAPMALDSYPEDKRPFACIGCKSCEAVCPQQIKVSEMMKDFTARMQ